MEGLHSFLKDIQVTERLEKRGYSTFTPADVYFEKTKKWLSTHKNYTSSGLYHFCSILHTSCEYELTSSHGTDHEPLFTYQVKVEAIPFVGRGTASTKKQAKNLASEDWFRYLKSAYCDTEDPIIDFITSFKDKVAGVDLELDNHDTLLSLIAYHTDSFVTSKVRDNGVLARFTHKDHVIAVGYAEGTKPEAYNEACMKIVLHLFHLVGMIKCP